MGANQQLALAGGFSPTNISGLVGWYQVDTNTSTNSLTDRSGNGNTLTTVGTAPTLTTNGGVNVLRWNGTTSTPLTTSVTQNFTNIFITTCYTDATFAGYNGLINAVSSVAVCIGDSGGSAWFDLADLYTYSKNGTVTSNTPMSGTLAVCTATHPTGQFTSGIMLCGDRTFGSARYWKGDVANMLIYNNGSMTAAQTLQCRQWCAANAGGIVTT